ncbi:MAG: YciI family protein [Pseudomonadota bacterium]
MKFLVFIATDQSVAHLEEPPGAIQGWVKEGEDRGIRVDGDRLRPPDHATLVRVRNGETLVTDGPFAETKEWIAGFDILECQDLAEAVDYVSRHPMAARGQVEIRPFWPI